MVIKVNIKSLIIGFLLGIIMILSLGAIPNSSAAGKYQLAVYCDSDGSFVFARMNTETGQVEASRIGILSIFPTKYNEEPKIFMRPKR